MPLVLSQENVPCELRKFKLWRDGESLLLYKSPRTWDLKLLIGGGMDFGQVVLKESRHDMVRV